MNATVTAPEGSPPKSSLLSRPLFAPVAAGVVSWAVISLGFLGLKMLMHERPEFVGQPMRGSKALLVQESPRIVARKFSDDVSIIRSFPPDFSEVRFQMRGRRDHRGLKTISDMSGQVTTTYTLTNSADESMFLFFQCPHPRTESQDGQSLLAGGFRLQVSVPGVQENTKDAWLWSGAAPAHASVVIELAYEVASLKGVTYRIADPNGTPLNRVRVTFNRQDLPSILFESGDGTIREPGDPFIWERLNFLGPDFVSANIVEGRNLFTALSQLVEIGPLISLLFILAVLAVILARQELTAIQVLTIGAGYGLYFPLMVYLSSRFSFAAALAIAAVIPGSLTVNYARWLIGQRLGFLGGPIFLGLYQVFPTLAAFAGWNRGLVLLCLGLVTFWVLINLQNRAFRRQAGTLPLLLAVLLPCGTRAAEIQVLLPAELAQQVLAARSDKMVSLLAYEPGEYQVRHEATHFRVEARLSFEVVRAGEMPTLLFAVPVHLQEFRIESAESNLVQLVTVTNRLSLYAQRTGRGTLWFSYRVPFENRDDKKRAQIPLVEGPPSRLRVESGRSDLEILTGSLWTRSEGDKTTVYDIGVAGEGSLAIEWHDQVGDARFGGSRQTERTGGFYGIGLARAQNLTVINSDGSCTHFTECELPAFQKGEFRLRLPPNARLISASLNGVEINAPIMDDQLCRIRLPDRASERPAHRLSFRLAYPPVRLGFAGTVELTLPEVFQTAGTLEWVVTLPDGFDTQVISTGLETQKAASDLSAFGDYGSVLKSHPQTHLTKTLAPPGTVRLNLRYRQIVPGIHELRRE